MRPIIAITCQRRAAGAVFKVEPALVVISDYVDAVWRAGGSRYRSSPRPASPATRTIRAQAFGASLPTRRPRRPSTCSTRCTA